MNTESTCYKISRGINGNPMPQDNLRLETSSTSFCLLSYHHMDFAKFESAREHDTLTISFLNHQVRIGGRNLRELAVAIQGRAVEFIKLVPGRYSAAAGNEAGFVETIEIDERSEQH